jgi:hypothetical protein
VMLLPILSYSGGNCIFAECPRGQSRDVKARHWRN